MLSVFNHKEMQEDTRNILEAMDMFITLCVVIVSEVYWYVQTPQNVYIKYVKLFVY